MADDLRYLYRQVEAVAARCERLLAEARADLRAAAARLPRREPWLGDPARGDLARAIRRARMRRALYGWTPGNAVRAWAARRG